MHIAALPSGQKDRAGSQDAPRPALQAPAETFWRHSLGLGVSVILAATPQVDGLTGAIATLPAPAQGVRPMVGQYLFMVKTLAAAWTGHTRPALAAAAAGLMHYGNSFTERDAPLLGAALLHCASGRADAQSLALRLVDGLVRRLAAPRDGLAALHADVGSYLAQMAAASSDLESDTVLLTQRLQADQVHAFLLAQHLRVLQDRLTAARAGRHGETLPEADGMAARLETAATSAALDGVRKQLDQLRARQGAASDEAIHLQGLMPGVAGYLGALDRLGMGIQAALAGTRDLQAQLTGLQQQLQARAADSSAAHAQLQSSLAAWRALAARLAWLALPAP